MKSNLFIIFHFFNDYKKISNYDVAHITFLLDTIVLEL